MPEGHSVRRLAIQFNDVFAGQRLAVSSPQGRFAAGAALLDGSILERAAAHGKQLFLHFAGGRVLHVHLGLYGAWSFGGDESFAGASSIGAPRKIGEREVSGEVGGLDSAEYSGPPDPVGAVRVRLASDHGWADLRGPTRCDAVTEAEAALAAARLGPDPLHVQWPEDASLGAVHSAQSAHDAGLASFAAGLRKRRTPVGPLLMDQAVIAGVGNIYRAEMLFRAGIDPYRAGSSLSAAEAEELWADAVVLLAAGVRDGRIITTDPSSWAGPVPEGGEEFHVYQHQGETCARCGGVIALAEMAGRKLYWCPGCQK